MRLTDRPAERKHTAEIHREEERQTDSTHADTFRLTWTFAVRAADTQGQFGAVAAEAAAPPVPPPPGWLKATPAPHAHTRSQREAPVTSQVLRGSRARHPGMGARGRTGVGAQDRAGDGRRGSGAWGREREDARASGQSWLGSQALGAGSGPRGSRGEGGRAAPGIVERWEVGSAPWELAEAGVSPGQPGGGRWRVDRVGTLSEGRGAEAGRVGVAGCSGGG